MNAIYPWRTGRSCVSKLFVHFVFVTKYRRGVLNAKLLASLKSIFAETCGQMEAELLEFGGEDDHVHLMIAYPPKIALATLVGKLKGKSSYIVRREFASHLKRYLWGEHFWSPSYCAVSCGGAPLDVVREYVANQRTPTNQANAQRSVKRAARGTR